MSNRNHRTRWTLRELRFLEKHYGKMDTTRIAEQLGRSVVAVRLAARSQGCRIIKVMASWTEEELAILRRHYAEGTGMQQLSQLLPGRNPKAIRAHAAKLGIQNGAWLDRLWSEEELAILCRYYPVMGAKVVDKLPGRTPEAAKQMASLLKVRLAGFSMAGVPQRRWTDEEWQILKDNVHLPSSELTGYLPGRTPLAIGKAKARLRAWVKTNGTSPDATQHIAADLSGNNSDDPVAR